MLIGALLAELVERGWLTVTWRGALEVHVIQTDHRDPPVDALLAETLEHLATEDMIARG